MQLYKISEKIMELLSIDTEGEKGLEEAISEGLQELEVDFYDKVDSIVKYRHQMDVDIVTIDNEIKRLQARKATISYHQEGLSQYLLMEMEKLGKKTITTALFTLTSRLGKNKVFIDNESEIPNVYINIKMSEAPDKRALLKALGEGEIKGCHLERGNNTLSIK